MNAEEPILPGHDEEKAFRIAYLISGYLKDDLTEDEHEELDGWVTENMNNQRLFEELTDKKNIDKWLDWKKELNIEQALERVRRKTSILGLLLPYISVAAGIAVVVALVLVFKTKNDRHNSSRFAISDIAPGGNHAVLVLADGTTILVDTVKNGILVNQGGSRVVKTDSGILSYQSMDKSGLPNDSGFNTLATPKGGQFQVVLADGTKVWLNASSSLRYPSSFSGTERKIELTGEAYFEVSKDASHPFVVSAAGTTTLVLGTHFDINAYDDEPAVKVTLVEGLVKVNNTMKIMPGEQALIPKGGGVKKSIADIKAETGWKDGYFVFKNTPLREVMLQISRWYGASTEYTDSVNEHFNTIISRQIPVSKLLHLLEATGSVHFRVEDKKISVMK